MRDVRQSVVSQALLPGGVEAVKVCVVDQQHFAFGTDEIAQELAVITVAAKYVDDAHSRTDARQAQDLRRLVFRVALDVGGAPARMVDRCIVAVPRRGSITEEQRRDEGQEGRRDERTCAAHGLCLWCCSVIVTPLPFESSIAAFAGESKPVGRLPLQPAGLAAPGCERRRSAATQALPRPERRCLKAGFETRIAQRRRVLPGPSCSRRSGPRPLWQSPPVPPGNKWAHANPRERCP